MSRRYLAAIFVALLAFQNVADAAKILGFFTSPSRSHVIIEESLMLGLAAKGHEVTIVSYFEPPKNAPENVRHLQLKMQPDTDRKFKSTMSSFFDKSTRQDHMIWSLPRLVADVGALNAETMQDPLVVQLKREASFDAVIIGWFMNDYQVGLAEHFGCPAVLVTPTPAAKFHRDFVGNAAGASHTPFAMSAYKQMNFQQRLLNFAVLSVEALVVELGNRFVLEPMYRQLYPPEKYPSFEEAKRNVALVLVTQHFSQNPPQASFPSLVEVSGMHIPKEARKLPKDIQTWLDGAEHGVIYFSMGSNVRSADMTPERRQAILRVFSQLKQRVLWKFEDDELAGRPDNVMIQKWLPQADILAHKNVRLFITHCGKGSINEARFHGVPLLGIPVFADQPGNLEIVVAEGWAVPLQYADLNEQTFAAALKEALTNPKYGQVVRKEAQLFADRPMHPLDTAVYWVEYVIRHKGAKHMQSQAVHLNWFQYYSLDVLGFLALAVWLSFKLTVWFWRRVCSLVCRRSSKAKKD